MRSYSRQTRRPARISVRCAFDVDEQHAVAIEAEVHVRERREGAHEQPRGDDEHDRQRDLRDDQAARQADPRRSLDDAAAVFLDALPSARRRPRETPAPSRRAAPSAMVTALVNASTRQSSERSRKTVFVCVDSWRDQQLGCPSARPAGRATAPTAESSRLSVEQLARRAASATRRAPAARSTRGGAPSRGRAAGSRCWRTRSAAPARRRP